MRYTLIFILIIFISSSCRMLNSSRMFKTEKDFNYAEFKNTETQYIIRPFDKLDLEIYTNVGFRLIDNFNQINKQKAKTIYTVEYDGQVKVPSLGRVSISGLTIREAEKMLEQKYSELYNKPFVLLNVTNKRVFLFTDGSNNAQVLSIENENFTLIEALAKSGGISSLSKAYKIKLIRGEINNPNVYLYNISTIEDMKEVNLVLQANDIIYVESRPKYASRVLAEILPYLSVISTGLLIYGLFK